MDEECGNRFLLPAIAVSILPLEKLMMTFPWRRGCFSTIFLWWWNTMRSPGSTSTGRRRMCRSRIWDRHCRRWRLWELREDGFRLSEGRRSQRLLSIPGSSLCLFTNLKTESYRLINAFRDILKTRFKIEDEQYGISKDLDEAILLQKRWTLVWSTSKDNTALSQSFGFHVKPDPKSYCHFDIITNAVRSHLILLKGLSSNRSYYCLSVLLF